MLPTNQHVSFVIPVKDERQTIEELCSRIETCISEKCIGYTYEIILIDDGSEDDSWEIMCMLQSKDPRLTAIKLRTNLGKARALSIGFQHSSGDIVFTLDADLQDDPEEIPRFIEKLKEGYDIVSGYKKKRHDPWHKVFPSRIFNYIVSKFSGVKLHDHNCGFKCYRSEVVKSLNLYGEMHRLIPAIASMDGFSSAELVVQHHPRRFGYSKYGVKRFYRGLMDMFTVSFLKRFGERPLHFMGFISSLFFCCGMFFYMMAFLGFFTNITGGSKASLFVLATILTLNSPIYFTVGLIGEMFISGRSGRFRKDTIKTIENETEAEIVFKELGTGKVNKIYALSHSDNKSKLIDLALQRDSEIEYIDIRSLDKLYGVNTDQSIVMIDIGNNIEKANYFIPEIRRNNKNIVIEVLTTLSDVKNVVKIMNLGASNVINLDKVENNVAAFNI